MSDDQLLAEVQELRKRHFKRLAVYVKNGTSYQRCCQFVQDLDALIARAESRQREATLKAFHSRPDDPDFNQSAHEDAVFAVLEALEGEG